MSPSQDVALPLTYLSVRLGEENAVQESNDAYLDGKDRDEDDLALPDDVDLDSTNDADDYDLDQAEILLTKQEIEAFA